MNPDKNDFQHKARAARDSLRTVLDEMRLKMKLASMEAKDAWDELEPQLRRVESRLEDIGEKIKGTGDEAELQAHLAGLEAKERWEAVQESVSGVISSLVDQGKRAKGLVDRAQLKAHLGRLDAEDYVQSKTREVKERWSERRKEATDEVSGFVDRLTGSLQRIKKDLDGRRDE